MKYTDGGPLVVLPITAVVLPRAPVGLSVAIQIVHTSFKPKMTFQHCVKIFQIMFDWTVVGFRVLKSKFFLQTCIRTHSMMELAKPKAY